MRWLPAIALGLTFAMLVSCSAPSTGHSGWHAMAPEAISSFQDEIMVRKARDQQVRSVDYDALDGDERGAAFQAWTRVDQENTAWIKSLVMEHGWPPVSVVGADASDAAFLLVQHADADPTFQAHCLPLLEDAAARNEVSRKSLAYLTDRVRVKQRRPQVYGTQYGPKLDDSGAVVMGDNGQPVYDVPLVEDVDRLDERRAAAGLGPWIEYERRMAELHGREPATRPRAAP